MGYWPEMSMNARCNHVSEKETIASLPGFGMDPVGHLSDSFVPDTRTDKRQACPRCGHQAYRDKQFQRTLHDLGNLAVWCPRDLVVTYSQHYCTKCRKYFNADLADLAP